MYKVLGSMLIILASSGIGISKGMDLQKYVRELDTLKQVLLMLRSEMKYAQAPLWEAFYHIGKRMRGSWSEWLLALSGELEEKTGTTFGELWNCSIEKFRRHTSFKRSDVEQLKALGMHMGYLDKEMQLGSIDLYLEQLEFTIHKARTELDTKRRLCSCLGVMGGVFLVVLFA